MDFTASPTLWLIDWMDSCSVMNVGPFDARAPVRGLGASSAPPLPSTSASCPARRTTAPSASSFQPPPPYHQQAAATSSLPHAAQPAPSSAPVLPPRPGQLQANRMSQHSPMAMVGASMRPAYGYGSAYPSSYGYGQGYGRGFSSAGYGAMGGYSAGFGSPGDGPIENRWWCFYLLLSDARSFGIHPMYYKYVILCIMFPTI